MPLSGASAHRVVVTLWYCCSRLVAVVINHLLMCVGCWWIVGVGREEVMGKREGRGGEGRDKRMAESM